MREWMMRLLAVGRRGRRDAEFEDEIRFHLDELTGRYRTSGLDPADARAAAERELGGVNRARQAWRDQRTWPPLEELLQDVQYGWRVLRRSPALALGAGLMLTIAVAATTSVFAVVDAVLLAPLPYGRAGRLVVINEAFLPADAPNVSVAPGNFMEWRDRARSLQAMTAVDGRLQNLTSDGDPEQVSVAAVSNGFAETVGRSPLLGRHFTPGEFEPGRGNVVLIGYGLWRRRYGADPSILGRSIVLDDRSYTVVGVMPPGFLFPSPQDAVWTPLPLTADLRDNRTGHQWFVMARVRDDVSMIAASRELHDVAADLRREYPASNGEWGVMLTPARQSMVGDTATLLTAIMGAVGMLLVVACANIAGLLLTRGFGRSRELAIRTALGATRWRIVRQLLTESFVLAVAAGAAGVAIAWLAQPVLAGLRPADFLAWKPIAIDVRAVIFALLTTTTAAVLFGTLPAIVVSRGRLSQAASARTGGRGMTRARQALVALELALAIVLVIGAALLAQTLARVTAVDLGFVPNGVVSMSVSLPVTRYADAGRVNRFYNELLDKMRALPGVRAAGAIQRLPLSGSTSVRPYRVEGAAATERPPVAHYRIVTPGYFETMRIPLRAGRTFTAFDTAEHPLAVVINETLRRQAFGDRNPIGARMSYGGDLARWGDVIGVIGDVRHFGPSTQAPPEMYWASPQLDALSSETLQRARRQLTLVVSTAGDPLAVVPAVRAAMREVDPDQPIATIRTMSSLVGASLWLSRASTWLLTIFGGAAATFALLGVFAAASYAVAQRRRELAVRLALGAAPSSVARTAITGALGASLVGIVAGTLAAAALGRAIDSMLVGVTRTDVRTLAASCVALALATVAACWGPARRAAHVDPIQALRVE